jgi:uncharacterized protein
MSQKRNLLVDFPKIVRAAKDRFQMDLKGIHGVSHWQRVRENGHRIAERTGVEPDLVDLFAYLHDCCREDDLSDPGHGERAAEFLRTLRGSLFDLEDNTFQVLFEAIRDHELGMISGNIVKSTCWDADRLDLGRVMIRPNTKFLGTEFAKLPDTLEWAYRRSLAT